MTAIIVLNYNGRRWLKECLDALLKTLCDDLHIILVDNASIDGSLDIVSPYSGQITIIKNSRNVGFSKGNNIGIKAALAMGANYIALINPDTKVKPDWLSHLINVGEANSSIGILGSIQLNYYDNEYNSWTVSALTQSDIDMANDVIHPDWVEGSCMVVKRSVFQNIGLLNPVYSSFFEEVDFCRRAKYSGYDIAIVPKSRIHHYRGGIWEADAKMKNKRSYQCDRGQLIYELTDPRRSTPKNIFWFFRTIVLKLKLAIQERNLRKIFDLIRCTLILSVTAPKYLLNNVSSV